MRSVWYHIPISLLAFWRNKYPSGAQHGELFDCHSEDSQRYNSGYRYASLVSKKT